MKLRGIELAGFKSFADKTNIVFEDGLTGIVGPNGCGKSNIADAVRWVLGEQGAKALRGSSMQDVIFNGTSLRKSLSYAEVSLIFDNSDHSIDLPYDEIRMTRKLYRSGESEYCLNNQNCRRTDLIEILHNSGVGKEGYSIIGQGKVQEIMLAKPQNRRAIFEEAAGIAMFKKRKQESESKLARTRENINILEVQLAEIGRQVEPLRKQAETAKTALKLKDELKIQEVNAYIFQHENAEVAKSEINARLKGYNENLAIRQEELDVAVLNYESAINEINDIDRLIGEIHDEILRHTVDLEKYAGEAKLIEEKLNSQTEQELRVKADLERLVALQVSGEEELKNKNAKKEELSSKISELRAKIDETSAKYLEAVDKINASEDQVELTQNSMIEALGKLGDVKANLSKLNAEKENLEKSNEDLTKRISAYSSKLSENLNLQTEAEDVFASIENRCAELTETVETVNKDYNNALFTLKRLDDELPKLMSDLSASESKQKILLEMQTEYDGFSGSVKRLLKDSETNKVLKEQMVGVVATLMKVPANYESAIEMALGNAVQNIVTKNEDDAKEVITYLKQKEYGRATFLPLTAIKGRKLDSSYERLLNRDGCFGIASELISFSEDLRNIFEGLLGTTVIVNNLDTAISLARDARFGFKIVTLEGDIVNPHGSMTGGSKKSDVANLLSREREIANITERVNALRKEVSSKVELKKELEKKSSDLKIELGIQTDAKHKYDVLFATEQEKLNKIVTYNTEYSHEIDSLKEELAFNESKLASINTEIKSIDKLEQMIAENKDTATDNISKSQQEFSQFRQDRDSFYEQLTNLKIKVAGADQELFSIEADISRLTASNQDAVLSIQENNASLERIQRQIAGLTASFETASKDEKYVEITNNLNLAKTKLANLDETKQSIQLKQKQSEEQKTSINAEIAKIGEKIYKEEMALAKVDTDIVALQERVYEEYELTYQTSLPFRLEVFDIKEGFTEINRLKKEIGKLGYINLNAIEDYKTQSERFELLNSEVADLRATEADCVSIIKQLSTEMSTRFEETFKIVNENFGKTFRELFNGGRAELRMVESETGDPLDDGVDIIAEPPGKKLTSIALLSGGEQALTAIAILFSILKYRSMPFCLLDEIEAALDDANVGRFASYLQRFSRDTQFIVITHRKPTMEQADSLYGVTMPEKGVSKIISVKLTDIADTVPDAK